MLVVMLRILSTGENPAERHTSYAANRSAMHEREISFSYFVIHMRGQVMLGGARSTVQDCASFGINREGQLIIVNCWNLK